MSNRIDSAIQDASRAVDRVAPELRQGVREALGVEAEQVIHDHALEMLASMPGPRPAPTFTPDDRARAARQLERAVAQFRRYAGRDGAE